MHHVKLHRLIVFILVLSLGLSSLFSGISYSAELGRADSAGERNQLHTQDRSEALSVIQSMNTSTPPDPEQDTIGWENGYWYNESISIDQRDGLSQPELRQWTNLAQAHVEFILKQEFTDPVSPRIATPTEALNKSQIQVIRNIKSNKRYQAWAQQVNESKFIVGENASPDPANLTAEDLLAGVLGYYDPSSDELVTLRTESQPVAVDNFTLHHELAHALQDQTYNLSRSKYNGDTEDQYNGTSGLIEGEAVKVEMRYQTACRKGIFDCVATPPEIYAPPRAFYGSIPSAHAGLFVTIAQPYTDGLIFYNHLLENEGRSAVQEAYENPPVSTEQTIHPERYPDEQPVPIEVEDTAQNGWQTFAVDGEATGVTDVASVPLGDNGTARVGELGLFGMFANQEFAYNNTVTDFSNFTEQDAGSNDFYNYTIPPAEGWGNDILVPYQKGNQGGYVWKLQWDSKRDATQFRDAYLQILAEQNATQHGTHTFVIPHGPFADAFYVKQHGKTVTIVNGPSIADLQDIRSQIKLDLRDKPIPLKEKSPFDKPIILPAAGTSLSIGPPTDANNNDVFLDVTGDKEINLIDVGAHAVIATALEHEMIEFNVEQTDALDIDRDDDIDYNDTAELFSEVYKR